MKYWLLASLVVIAALLIACGAGHPNLTSMVVAPATATAASTPQTTVGFTATGKFSNNTSRILTAADGLSWRTSNTAVATIDDLGIATCQAPGSVTVTASAPQNLQLTINNGISNTAVTIRATGTLNCQ
jgi:methionine-rich copper-binding protein CopC